MMPELWRVYRVAKLLDVSKKRVYQMVQEGKIAAVRLGPRSMRITRESIDKFITEGAKKNREELAHARRLSSLGEMAANLAHELNQPLAAMLSNAA